MSNRDVPGTRLGADLSTTVINTNKRARQRFIHLLRIGLEKRERLQRTLIAFNDVNRNVRFQDYRERIFGVLEKIVDTILTNDAIYEKVRQHVLRRYGTYRSMKRKPLKEGKIPQSQSDEVARHEKSGNYQALKKVQGTTSSPQMKMKVQAARDRLKKKWAGESSERFNKALEVSPDEAKRVNDKAFKRVRGMEPRRPPRSDEPKQEAPAAKPSLYKRMMQRLGRG